VCPSLRLSFPDTSARADRYFAGCVQSLVRAHGVGFVVLGWPCCAATGTATAQTRRVEAFEAALREVGIVRPSPLQPGAVPVFRWDERYSSARARRMLALGADAGDDDHADAALSMAGVSPEERALLRTRSRLGGSGGVGCGGSQQALAESTRQRRQQVQGQVMARGRTSAGWGSASTHGGVYSVSAEHRRFVDEIAAEVILDSFLAPAREVFEGRMPLLLG
jgi:RNase H-fold protein (predicted Holliday junction resolvase)